MTRHLSTFAIAKLLHVDPGSVANWIDQGLLKAHRTPGGHRRVRPDDLVEFLDRHRMPRPPQFSRPALRILIVDGEPEVARTVACAVRAAHPDSQIVEAYDGFRAGSALATLAPDVVVLDLRVPGMDGYEVCRMIKSSDATRHATILAVMTCPTTQAHQEILKCGASVCLPKPLDMDDLLRRIAAVTAAAQ